MTDETGRVIAMPGRLCARHGRAAHRKDWKRSGGTAISRTRSPSAIAYALVDKERMACRLSASSG